jgi:hypothetical protein
MSNTATVIDILDSITSDSEHEWESVGYKERIETTTITGEYECINCGKNEYQYFELEDLEEVY